MTNAAEMSRAIKRALWHLSFEKPVAFDNPGDCRWRLSSSAVRIIESAITAALVAERANP